MWLVLAAAALICNPPRQELALLVLDSNGAAVRGAQVSRGRVGSPVRLYSALPTLQDRSRPACRRGQAVWAFIYRVFRQRNSHLARVRSL